jgi:RNA recognition motif-containing protein
MKSWADHCSSDEESFNEDTPLDTFDDDDDAPKIRDDPVAEPEVAPQEARTYQFPSGPPYTIFVGNLSYEIRDGRMLEDALAAVIQDRLQQEIKVFGGKIPSLQQQQPGQPPRHKGFGYVEVSSIDEVSTVLLFKKKSTNDSFAFGHSHYSLDHF